MEFTRPEGKAHRAFEDEGVCVPRGCQPNEEPFDPVAGKDELEVLSGRSVEVQEPLLDGCRGVRHATASTYGRMTFSIRHTLAAAQSSFMVAFFCRQQSRRASIATSSPTLFRNLKQSATVL